MRKKKDLYMWLGKMPHGPTAKFLVENSEFVFLEVSDSLSLFGLAHCEK